MQENRRYSTEFNNIIKSSMPDILKWGWFVIGSLFILIVIMCYLIRYPNILTYQISLNRDVTASRYTGIILLSSTEECLFEQGKSIQVKLSEYPVSEYGILVGSIEDIQFNPQINKKVITVVFPQELITSTGKRLAVQKELTGYCEMLIKQERLIKKILSSLSISKHYNGTYTQ